MRTTAHAESNLTSETFRLEAQRRQPTESTTAQGAFHESIERGRRARALWDRWSWVIYSRPFVRAERSSRKNDAGGYGKDQTDFEQPEERSTFVRLFSKQGVPLALPLHGWAQRRPTFAPGSPLARAFVVTGSHPVTSARPRERWGSPR
jgi:hypothetical protein